MSESNQPVLLVEDDENDVLFLRRAFKQAGIPNSLHVVNNGDEAIEYLAGSGRYADRALFPMPAFVLLDLKMPRRTGLEVLAWAKRRPGVKRIPIVMLTSSKSDTDVNDAYELGANSYLVKPVAFERLIELTRSLRLYWLGVNEPPAIVP
jgi:CheY-like chemotaxis protein